MFQTIPSVPVPALVIPAVSDCIFQLLRTKLVDAIASRTLRPSAAARIDTMDARDIQPQFRWPARGRYCCSVNGFTVQRLGARRRSFKHLTGLNNLSQTQGRARLLAKARGCAHNRAN